MRIQLTNKLKELLKKYKVGSTLISLAVISQVLRTNLKHDYVIIDSELSPVVKYETYLDEILIDHDNSEKRTILFYHNDEGVVLVTSPRVPSKFPTSSSRPPSSTSQPKRGNSRRPTVVPDSRVPPKFGKNPIHYGNSNSESIPTGIPKEWPQNSPKGDPKANPKSNLEEDPNNSCPKEENIEHLDLGSKKKKQKKEAEQCIIHKVKDVEINFDYTLEDNGDVTLLIPNYSEFQSGKNKDIEIRTDQTKTHLHHFKDSGMELPETFDMIEYGKLETREDKIAYATEHMSDETILEYQNFIGKQLTEDSVTHVNGFAGEYKTPNQIKINTENKIVSIVSEKNVHISTFQSTPGRIRTFIKDGFWILKNKKIY